MLWLVLLMGFIVAVLIFLEYQDHDCMAGKKCHKRVSKPNFNDDPLKSIDKIQKMVKNNYDFVTWRLALLAGIIGALPIVYYIEHRVPTLFEWIIVAMLVFAAAYLSSSWIWAHFFHPNGCQIEKSLTELRDKVHKIVRESRDFSSGWY